MVTLSVHPLPSLRQHLATLTSQTTLTNQTTLTSQTTTASGTAATPSDAAGHAVVALAAGAQRGVVAWASGVIHVLQLPSCALLGTYTLSSNHPAAAMRLNCNDSMLAVLDAGDVLHVLALTHPAQISLHPAQTSLRPAKDSVAPAAVQQPAVQHPAALVPQHPVVEAVVPLHHVASLQDVWAWVWHGNDAQCMAVVGRGGVRVWRDGQLGDPLRGPGTLAHVQLAAFDGLTIQVP